MRVGGFVQRRGPLRPDGRHEMYVEDLRDGGRIRLDRYRGPGAVACTLDMEAMAVLSMTLRAHIRARPDILFVNRFGVREAEGGGLREDIAQAVCENIRSSSSSARRICRRGAVSSARTRMSCRPPRAACWIGHGARSPWAEAGGGNTWRRPREGGARERKTDVYSRPYIVMRRKSLKNHG
uniref:Uncharacterized protein orf11 n=1 Tax=Gluconacetobacter diazotrophicus TaxID=33996 RepID=Q9F1E3_GLUDI|nr:unknown [Gluconacetobacter diazotrophicus PA1 5]